MRHGACYTHSERVQHSVTRGILPHAWLPLQHCDSFTITILAKNLGKIIENGTRVFYFNIKWYTCTFKSVNIWYVKKTPTKANSLSQSNFHKSIRKFRENHSSKFLRKSSYTADHETMICLYKIDENDDNSRPLVSSVTYNLTKSIQNTYKSLNTGTSTWLSSRHRNLPPRFSTLLTKSWKENVICVSTYQTILIPIPAEKNNSSIPPIKKISITKH